MYHIRGEVGLADELMNWENFSVTDFPFFALVTVNEREPIIQVRIFNNVQTTNVEWLKILRELPHYLHEILNSKYIDFYYKIAESSMARWGKFVQEVNRDFPNGIGDKERLLRIQKVQFFHKISKNIITVQ